ncbi:sodium:proton antiporter [Mucilaginibacter sp. AK015]|uniref:cation:proton antiporter n=1 Tax=Mucilaginibacter sp. AK015 TaxID=2723072 RepID=UPI001613A43A|nr:sodium:proton antiporter [Mucilaginibacter sp. AK015]MBB5394047.1 CPA1 family monovalent cation:H+ antiporter [Mucilaginibacter sp. AK015]
METREIITITIVLAALFAYINHRFIKWPPTIGIMALSLISSVLLVLLGNSRSLLSEKAIQLANSVDFQDVLMNFMLSFLLFAGAIHIDAGKLKKERWPVLLLATIGILISTALVGVMTWGLFQLFALPIPFIYCLLFGALISPTDPIAVMGILKQARIPSSLEIKIAGESLFNDGVAVVIFISIAQIARSVGGDFSAADVGKLFLQEAVGGLAFGALLGYLGFLALRSIDDYKVEVLLTLALVMGGYTLASHLHVSGPLAMVVAGIITGNKAKEEGMSDETRDYLDKFWHMIDEILNAVLFLFIGLEMLIIKINSTVMIIGGITILIVLLARWLSVVFPVMLLRYKIKFENNAIAILTWGGLRGGISVALALSLGSNMYRDEFVLITYIIVVFSILVQGLTIGKLAQKLQAKSVK